MSKLTREAVLDRALAIADEEGIEAVTIRRLAGELEVTPMALYWHFKNKEEMLTAGADHLLAGVTRHVTPGKPWNEQLRLMVESVVRAMRAHPCLPALLHRADKTHVQNFTQVTDTALGLLAEAGFSLTDGFAIAGYLFNGVTGLVHYQPDCHPGMPAEEAAEVRRLHRLKLESLPADRYPRMVEYARTTADEPDIDHYYSFGVDLLIAGVEAMAARQAPASATPESTA